MKGRLKIGDFAIADTQSGDCFWNYYLVNHNSYLNSSKKKFWEIIPESYFGAYVLGSSYIYQPTDKEMHLLLGGEKVFLSAEPDDR